MTCTGTVCPSVYLSAGVPVSGGDAFCVFLTTVVPLLPTHIPVPVPPVSVPRISPAQQQTVIGREER